MSVLVMSLVFTQVNMQVNRKMVLLKLADHADDDGCNAYPSVASLARHTGVSERTVQNILGEFREQNVIIADGSGKGGRKRTTNYRIDIQKAMKLYPFEDKKGAAAAPLRSEKDAGDSPFREIKGAAGDIKGAAGDIKGAADDNKGCKAAAPESSLTILKNHPAREGDVQGGSPQLAHWRATRLAMVAAFGEEVTGRLMTEFIVHLDDGEKIELWAVSGEDRDWFDAEVKAQVEALLNREVEVSHHPIAARAVARKAGDERERLAGLPKLAPGEAERLIRECRGRLVEKFGEEPVAKWVDPLRVVDGDGSAVVLHAAIKFNADQARGRFGAELEQLIGRPVQIDVARPGA